jgi:hypothetical protein
VQLSDLEASVSALVNFLNFFQIHDAHELELESRRINQGITTMTGSDDYARLTVPQLKALCKESKLVGYSKLCKTALVEKLKGRDAATANVSSATNSDNKEAITNEKESNSCAEAASPPSSFRSHQQVGTQIVTVLYDYEASQKRPTPAGTLNIDIRGTASVFPSVITNVQQTQGTDGKPSAALGLSARDDTQARSYISMVPHATAVSSGSSAMPPPSVVPGPLRTPFKRMTISADEASSKRAKVCPPGQTISPSSPTPTVYFVDGNSNNSGLVTKLSSQTRLEKETTSRPVPNTVLSTATISGKRFRPLVINKKLAGPTSKTHEPFTSIKSHSISPARGASCDIPLESDVQTSPDQEAGARYLEFLSYSVPELVSISLPPPLAHRKYVQRWAIILSQVDEGGCKNCILVSKMLRYAGR